MIRFKECRNKKGVTQQDVADVLNITRAGYSNIENGKREPDYESLCKLADYFEVSIDYLLGRTNNPALIDEVFAAHTMDHSDLAPELAEKLEEYKQMLIKTYGDKKL